MLCEQDVCGLLQLFCVCVCLCVVYIAAVLCMSVCLCVVSIAAVLLLAECRRRYNVQIESDQ